MCLMHNVKKIVRKVIQGTITLPGKYNAAVEQCPKGICLRTSGSLRSGAEEGNQKFEEVMSRYRDDLTLVEMVV